LFPLTLHEVCSFGMELFPWTTRIWPLRADTPKKKSCTWFSGPRENSTREIAHILNDRNVANYRQAMVGDDRHPRARPACGGGVTPNWRV
jgi:hypothetical protein